MLVGFKVSAVSDDLEMKAITENMSFEEATIRGPKGSMSSSSVTHSRHKSRY